MAESLGKYIVDANVRVLDRLVLIQDFGYIQVVPAYNDRKENMVDFTRNNVLLCRYHFVDIRVQDRCQSIYLDI